MVIKAKYPVQLNGHCYMKGETVDFCGTVTQRIASNFTLPDGTALAVCGEEQPKTVEQKKTEEVDTVKATIAKTVETMKRDGICRALDAIGVTYSPKSKTEYLAKLLLMSKGEIEE